MIIERTNPFWETLFWEPFRVPFPGTLSGNPFHEPFPGTLFLGVRHANIRTKPPQTHFRVC